MGQAVKHYSDVPEGFRVYSDIPEGFAIAHDPVAAKPATAEDYPGRATTIVDTMNAPMRFASSIAETLSGIPSMVRHPVNSIVDMGRAQVGELRKAHQAIDDKRYSEAVGHGVASLIPFAGPMAANAGETIGGGDVASGLGTAALLTAPAIAEGIGKGGKFIKTATGPIRDTAADALRASAERSIKQVLHPTTNANKVLAERVAPRLAAEGPLGATLKSYGEKVKSEKYLAGDALAEAHAAVPVDRMIQTRGILDAIEKSKVDSGAVVHGERGPVVVEPDLVRSADQLKGIIEEFGPEVSYKSMVALRQRWDKTVAKAKGFVQPDLGAAADMKREAVSAIREELAREEPSVAKLNAEYSFWANADKVLGDTVKRKTGQATPLGEQIATAAGAAGELAVGGGIAGALKGAAVVRGLTKLFRSTAWRTASARVKSVLADAIASGDPQAIESTALTIQQNPVRVNVTGTIQQSSGKVWPMKAPVSGLLPESASPVPASRLLGRGAIPMGSGPDTSAVTGIPARYSVSIAKKIDAGQVLTSAGMRRAVKETTIARMNEIKDVFRSGVGELTGKAIGRDSELTYDAKASGLHNARRVGGVKDAFPELKDFPEDPGVIAAAIERGSGPLFDRISKAIMETYTESTVADVLARKGEPSFDPSRFRPGSDMVQQLRKRFADSRKKP